MIVGNKVDKVRSVLACARSLARVLGRLSRRSAAQCTLPCGWTRARLRVPVHSTLTPRPGRRTPRTRRSSRAPSRPRKGARSPRRATRPGSSWSARPRRAATTSVAPRAFSARLSTRCVGGLPFSCTWRSGRVARSQGGPSLTPGSLLDNADHRHPLALHPHVYARRQRRGGRVGRAETGGRPARAVPRRRQGHRQPRRGDAGLELVRLLSLARRRHSPFCVACRRAAAATSAWRRSDPSFLAVLDFDPPCSHSAFPPRPVRM